MVSPDGSRNRRVLGGVILVSIVALFHFWNNDGIGGALQTGGVLQKTSTRSNNTVSILQDDGAMENGRTFGIISDEGIFESALLRARNKGAKRTGAPPMPQQDDAPQAETTDDAAKEGSRVDLLDIKNVKRKAEQARDAMVARLQQDYGHTNFQKIFQRDGKSRHAIVPIGTESTKRFKRKLKIKLLNTQQAIQQEREQSESSKGSPLQQHHSYERLVWATGGHSAAAGHGNLFNQSYTAYMERAVIGVFYSVGIDFEGRNFAMGGTSSGPEIALCEEAVFGTDIDVLSWDYGMIDGSWKGGEAMYQHRASLTPSRPILVDINVASRKNRFQQQSQLLQSAEERGQAAFYLKPEEMQDMKSNVPDTFGLSEDEISMMPRMVRHLKCQGSFENGDPGCDKDKFTNRNGPCKHRKGMSSWHPGW